MQWKDILTQQAEEAFRATTGLVARIDPAALDWRPETGANWMSTGQLLEHIKIACGAVMYGFATGDWSKCMPEGSPESEGQMPTAEQLPTCGSVEEFTTAFEEDCALAFKMIEEASAEDLDQKMIQAPWNPTDRSMGVQFQECILHLNSHKAQLFYYLKLQGQDVNTMHLWGLDG